MFGFFRTEEVVPLSLEESLLSFHTGRKFKPGKTVKVKLILLVLGEVETPTVSVTISEVDAQAEGGYKCLGLLREKPERVASLTLTMARAGIEGADRRGSKRLNFGARILSRKLPNFRAVTANINLTGAEILCEGAVETGLSMSLQFDLETVGMRELTLQAVTVWAGGSSVDKKSAVFRVGVKFTETHQRTMTAWQQLYQHLASVEGSSVMHRSMGGAVEADDPLGVRKDAKGAFASPTAGHQGNVPGPPPSAPGPLDLPKTSSSFGSATNPVGHGYLQAPPPPARGRIGLPPTREPGSTTGLPLTPASPAPPSSAPLGFEAPRNPSVPGFQPPPPPAGSDVSGFHPPRATSGPSFPGFQAPTLPGQQPGSGFRPPSPPAPSLSGFQPPPPPAGSAPVGFQPPPPPAGSAPVGFQPPPPPAGSAPVGFQPPPPPAGSAPVGFQPPPPPAGSAPVGFQPPPPPAGSAPVGFQPPPPPPPSTGFRPPPPPAGYKPDPPPR